MIQKLSYLVPSSFAGVPQQLPQAVCASNLDGAVHIHILAPLGTNGARRTCGELGSASKPVNSVISTTDAQVGNDQARA